MSAMPPVATRVALTVTGPGSIFSNLSGGLFVGYTSANSNALVISHGGVVYNNGDLTIGNSSGSLRNGATVTDNGSVLTNTGDLVVGNFLLVPTFNSLTVSNGGKIFTGNAYVGGNQFNNALNCLLTVTGPGSVLQVANDFHLGGGAAGGDNNSAVILDGGLLEANSPDDPNRVHRQHDQ